MGQIAAAVKRPHSSISRSLKQLEGGGYVMREKRTIKTTAAGMDIVREDLRPAAETIASIAASYKGLRSIGEQFQISFSLVRDLAEGYQRNFKVIAEVAQQVQNNLRIVTETGQALQEAHAFATGNAFQVGQAVQAAVRQFDDTLRTLRPIFSELAKVPAANKTVQEKLLPRGWLFSPELSIGEFLWIYRELEAHPTELAESRLVDHFDERCEELIDETYEYQPFQKRKHLLDQALGAHRRGEYGLAIPVFLSAIEGVVIDSFGDDKLFSNKSRWMRRVPVDRLTEAFFEAFWTTMVDTLWKGYGLKEKVPAQVLSRHLILHGRSVDYDTKRNSVQAVLALHYLAFIVSEHIKRTSAA